MMINRHNYEEFFLLYTDGELNSQQCAEVELFVEQNPDMAAELEMLMQMKLEPEDAIVFPDKSLLFKTADVEISINNYEEFFLLYIDGELAKDAAEKVEKFVLQHPALQGEFTLLKQTVLQPEAITFADKSSLYRKEERRVGYIGFARLAAAAAIIGLVLTGWWFYPKNSGGVAVNAVATNTPKVTGASRIIAPKSQTIEPQKQVQAQADATASIAEVKSDGKKITQKLIQKDSKFNAHPLVTPANTDDNAVASVRKIDRPIDELTTSANNPVASLNNATAIATPDKTPEPVGQVIQPLTDLINSTSGTTETTSATKGKTQDKPFTVNPNKQALQAQAQTVAYKEIDTNDDDRSMYVGSLELNKDKVKGFFKRAGRLFGGRSKKDTD